MPHRRPRHRFTLRRLLPLVALAAATSSVSACTTGADTETSARTEPKTQPSSPPSDTLRRFGLSVALPPGWHGRISSGAETEAGLPSILNAASFPLRPGDPDDVGGPASRRMRPDDLRIMLLEFPPEQAGRQGFRRGTLPIAIEQSDAVALPTIPRDHAVARVRFSIRGRPFSLFVEFGKRPPNGAAIRTANRVLASLEIGDRADRSPAVWGALRRPLALPAVGADAPCPRSRTQTTVPGVARPLGKGPAYPSLGSATGLAGLADDLVKAGWHLHKTLWAISPRYRGPVLIRGARLDAPGGLRFDLRIARELRLPPLEAGEASKWRYAPSYTAVRSPGCYALRIDGTGFRSLVAFEIR